MVPTEKSSAEYFLQDGKSSLCTKGDWSTGFWQGLPVMTIITHIHDKYFFIHNWSQIRPAGLHLSFDDPRCQPRLGRYDGLLHVFKVLSVSAGAPRACIPASLDTGNPSCQNLGSFSVTMCCSKTDQTCHKPTQSDLEYGQKCLQGLAWFCCNSSLSSWGSACYVRAEQSHTGIQCLVCPAVLSHAFSLDQICPAVPSHIRGKCWVSIIDTVTQVTRDMSPAYASFSGTRLACAGLGVIPIAYHPF